MKTSPINKLTQWCQQGGTDGGQNPATTLWIMPELKWITTQANNCILRIRQYNTRICLWTLIVNWLIKINICQCTCTPTFDSLSNACVTHHIWHSAAKLLVHKISQVCKASYRDTQKPTTVFPLKFRHSNFEKQIIISRTTPEIASKNSSENSKSMLPPISSRASNFDHTTHLERSALVGYTYRQCFFQWGEAGPNPTGSGHRQYGTSNIAMLTAPPVAGSTRCSQVYHQQYSKHRVAGTPRGEWQGTASWGEPLSGTIPLLFEWAQLIDGMPSNFIKIIMNFQGNFGFPLKIWRSNCLQATYNDEILEELRYSPLILRMPQEVCMV